MKRIALKMIMIVSIVIISFLSCTSEPVSEPGKEAIKQYTITFDKNDTGATGTMSAQTIASGSSANLTANGFAKIGWTFAGWSKTTDGEVEYADAASYTMGTSSVILYAKWTFICDAAGVTKRELVLITGGSYNQKATSGTPDNFDHTISNFEIGKYEVTYELWYNVYQWAISSGYTFANAGKEGNDGAEGSAPTTAKYEPVTTVNWRDTIVWCNAYSEMSGFTPCYSYSSSTIKDSRDSNSTACDAAICNWSANGYRLPSEGEWQYAASNKGATAYNYASGATANYNDAAECQAVAWYFANSESKTHDVGEKRANSSDLYDMSGNVYEFCWDWYGEYPSSSQTNYRGSISSSDRIVRGGYWSFSAGSLQVGYRYNIGPIYEVSSIGFRVARTQ